MVEGVFGAYRDNRVAVGQLPRHPPFDRWAKQLDYHYGCAYDGRILGWRTGEAGAEYETSQWLSTVFVDTAVAGSFGAARTGAKLLSVGDFRALFGLPLGLGAAKSDQIRGRFTA